MVAVGLHGGLYFAPLATNATCCVAPCTHSIHTVLPAVAVLVLQLDGEQVDPPRPLPWYPNKLGWHMNFSRNQLRKLSWLADIHVFMKVANEAGSITRQEAVSMVPPLFMDVKPHHRVSGWRVSGA